MNMKISKIAILLLVLWMPTFLNAQNRPVRIHSDLHHELGISAGPNSIIGGTVYGTVGFFGALFSGLGHERTRLDFYGEYGLHYYYQVKPWCQVGVKTTIDAAKMVTYTDTTYSTVSRSSTFLLLSVMASVRFTYLNRPWVRLYSGVDLGCGFLFTGEKSSSKSEEGKDSDNDNILFAFNVTPIGVNVGKRFFGMAEINFGFDSWFKVGIGCRW